MDTVMQVILQRIWSEGLFQEPVAAYGDGEQVAWMEAEELVRMYRAVRSRMEELGIDAPSPSRTEPTTPEVDAPGAAVREPEVLRITRRYRIFLPGRQEEELRLRPLVKTVFIFFLKHPEGVAAKCLSDYRSELLSIYGRISGRDDPAAQAATVDRLVDAMDNSLHENCSRLNAGLSAIFPKETLDQYQVQGSYGEPKRIALKRMYVRWEG